MEQHFYTCSRKSLRTCKTQFFSLHKLQYCNVSCVLDNKLLYKGRWHYYCILLLTYLISYYYNVFGFVFCLVSLHGDQCRKCTAQRWVSPWHYTADPMLLPSENPFKCHEEILYLQPMIPPKRFGIFPSDWGMLTRSRCVQIFLYIGIGSHATELERYYPRKKVIYNDFLGPATIISV